MLREVYHPQVYFFMKRSRLKPRSRKKVLEIKAAGKDRDAFRREFPICMACRNKTATDIHEIPRGPARRKAYGDRRGWLHLCRPCHEEIGDYSKVPIERALVLKWRFDPAHFDLAWINTTRNRAPTAITLKDLEEHR